MSLVRVFGSAVYFELLEHGTREFVFRKHALDCVCDDEFGPFFTKIGNRSVLLAAHVTTVEHVLLLVLFGSGKLDFVRVEHDDVITGIDMGRVNRFVATTQCVGNRYGQSTKNLVGGVDDLPIVRGGFWSG